MLSSSHYATPVYYTAAGSNHRCFSKSRVQRRRNGGTTGALAPAMLKPRGREYLFAPEIFSHIFACSSLNFHSLSLCCLHTIKTSYSVGTTGRILRITKRINTTYIPSENFENRVRSNTYMSRTSLKPKMFAPAMLKSFRRLCESLGQSSRG